MAASASRSAGLRRASRAPAPAARRTSAAAPASAAALTRRFDLPALPTDALVRRLEAAGGEVVLVEILQGHSTTSLVARAREGKA